MARESFNDGLLTLLNNGLEVWQDVNREARQRKDRILNMAIFKYTSSVMVTKYLITVGNI